MTRFLTSVSLALCLSAGLVAGAAAQPADGANEAAVSRFVPVGDLDLHTQAGAKIAAQRIWVAAEDVCGGGVSPPGFEYFRCRNAAIDSAAASLKAPLVSAALGRRTAAGLASR